jgi:hypothetical protein
VTHLKPDRRVEDLRNSAHPGGVGGLGGGGDEVGVRPIWAPCSQRSADVGTLVDRSVWQLHQTGDAQPRAVGGLKGA